MARQLRIEYAGALYHITSRGNAREAIYRNDEDRIEFLTLLDNTCNRFNWYCHAYCLMDNHYHLLIETNTSSLSKGMKYLNGTYTQFFNRSHKRFGHVYQGRFKGILVEKESYLLELSRYIVLNPVRARMVRTAKDWQWSSYRATAGISVAHSCLATDWLLACFCKQRKRAQQAYREFIQRGKNQPSPWENLKNQIYLGSSEFVEEMQCKLEPDHSLNDIPKKQKQAAIKPLGYYQQQYPSRSEAMAKAYLAGHYTLKEVGQYFGVSYATVSRAVKEIECDM
jgi:REP element-mobilizing transposase RayT